MASPCPFSTYNWTKQKPYSSSYSAPEVLGPHPAQNFCTGSSSSMDYCSTEIDHTMHNLSLSSPDEQYYMDTNATSHMSHSQGTFLNYCPLKYRFNNAIVVGNGHMISIHDHGHVSLPCPNQPLTLKNVLHAPKLIKNLIFVQKFTNDNMVSFEFDPFGFSVKELDTGNIIMRSNNTSDLYHFILTHRATSFSSSSFAFFASSSST
ncbi:uncharacterized protein LOC130824771 [Amaranthus tricolor]|uniref:uncharacterized protein LOC130824771 n=1 Tax=Amaranthus tricolor TaxID=29722 RepID=UPI0025845C42|nr:uncharacterized protein LOC130824771 [Amaranthus tricolor]